MNVSSFPQVGSQHIILTSDNGPKFKLLIDFVQLIVAGLNICGHILFK